MFLENTIDIYNVRNWICGPFRCWGKDGMFKVTDLHADTSVHFKAVKVYDNNGYINLKWLGHQSLVS